MNHRSALQRLAAAAARAPRAHLPILSDEQLNEDIERFLGGEWEGRDLVEMRIDHDVVKELSTAASVGSGVSQGLGHGRPDEDKQLEKLLGQLEGYRRRLEIAEMRPKDVRQFAVELGLPEHVGEALLEYLRRRGDV